MPEVLRRILAHEIVYEGGLWRLAIAELRSDGTVEITPFDCETPGTVFISGRVEIEKKKDFFLIKTASKAETISFHSQSEGV